MEQQRDTVIVTGSGGLIGSAVVKRLARHFQVIGFDREGTPPPPPEAERIIIDLTEEQTVHRALDEVRERHGERIASVIHLAAYYDFSGEPSPLYDEVTVRGTERLLRGLKKHQFHVEQFVFSSTMLVHPPCNPGERINEDWPLEPKWVYPESKVKTERLLLDQHGDIPIVNLRIAGVYDEICHSVPVSQQIQRIAERQLIAQVFPGDISHGQAFIHLDDLIDAFELMTLKRRELPPETTLLLGEPETLSYDDLQRMISKLIHDEELETREIPKSVAKTGAWLQDVAPVIEDPFIKPWMIDIADDHYELDTGRARDMLGWEAKRLLRETLPMMIESLKSDPEGFYRENKLGSPPENLDV